MDAYNLTPKGPEENERWVDQIASSIERSRLSFRSRREIRIRLKHGEVWGVVETNKLVAFLFATPLTEQITEIHAAYTTPNHRNQGLFSRLLRLYTEHNNKKQLFAVVLKEQFARHLMHNHGFQKISPESISWSLRWEIACNRMYPYRILSTIKTAATSNPTYLIR
jgi:N-acetylglutamate synthase-like GNAT family acetyltransferase